MTHSFSTTGKVICACFAIVFNKRPRASIRSKSIAAMIMLIMMVSVLAVSIAFGGYIWTTTCYTALSAAKQFAISNAERIGWNFWMSGDIYETANSAKENLISTNNIAEFLDSCNVNGVGKEFQLFALLLGTGIFVFIIVVSCKAIFMLVNCYMDNYLKNHKGSERYVRKLNGFIQVYKSKLYSSKEMKKHHLFYVFREEEAVMRLLSAKQKREANEIKCTH